jgi:DHA2 family multidrug resistance protein
MASPAPRGQSSAADTVEHGPRLVLIVLAVMAATLMQTLDSTITNVALPTIQGNLGASQDEGTWIVTSYTIAAIIVIPITPWLQNTFGRRNYFVASIVGFTVCSFMCGAASDLSFLIFSRVLQGVFGGGLLATAQSVLRDSFPPRKLGISQGIYALGAILGPALGPPLGVIIVDNATWNWVFDINIVPGTFAALVLFAMLKDPGRPKAGAIDIGGLIFLSIGLGTMQYVLTEGERNYWFASAPIAIAAVLCVASLAAFVWYELKAAHNPIVDLRVFKNRSVAAGSLLALALGGVIFGSTYTLPQFTQGPLGFTPTLSGELFILRALPIALLTPIIVNVAAKIDSRWLLGFGFIFIAIGCCAQAWISTIDATFWTFATGLVLVGIGAAMLFTPLSIAVLGATTPTEGPKASAMVNLSLQLGGSITIAALDVLIDRSWAAHSQALGANVTLANPVVQQALTTTSVAQISNTVNLQASIIAYADATYAIAFLAIIFAPLIFLMRKPKKMAGNHAIDAG